MQRRACGFTLIEVAIVFAIIGLVVTGILLSGSGVFGRTGVASLLSNVKDLATAAREFKVRYGYFPGDLPGAGTVLKVTPAISTRCANIVDPNIGDGIVNTVDESDCALEHLVRAGMLTKIDFDNSAPTPKFVIASTVGVEVRVSLWFNPASNENAIRITKLPCDVALDIERKLDSTTSDDKPFSQGAVTARDDANVPINNCTAGGANDPVATLLIKY